MLIVAHRERAAPVARASLAENPYGLTLAEVRAEICRCLARGWQLWEIRRRFTAASEDRPA
ncbi:hypothetical protein [Streptomyces iconiensis]|uniref:Uncharacterized protein n=1 Tax=Streptomyces iconiensis TaxID=1384038 RepID=A0ABT6ZRT0_9ACTN|nr:hypothetical protein [Streptomyces iconiensis]MDJ1131764.1 hypothetical protein [Streptomyces iconiensis]